MRQCSARRRSPKEGKQVDCCYSILTIYTRAHLKTALGCVSWSCGKLQCGWGVSGCANTSRAAGDIWVQQSGSRRVLRPRGWSGCDTSYNRRGLSELSGYDKPSEFSHSLDIPRLKSFHLLREIGGFGLCGSPHLEGASECSFTFLVAAREM